MTLSRTAMMIAVLSVAPGGLVVAQSPSSQSPSTMAPSTTSPSSASSPHQRDATSSSSPEASTSDSMSSSDPSAASSPHQQQTAKMNGKQSMKDCVTKQQSDNSGMSASDAKKACKAQMKNDSGH